MTNGKLKIMKQFDPRVNGRDLSAAAQKLTKERFASRMAKLLLHTKREITRKFFQSLVDGSDAQTRTAVSSEIVRIGEMMTLSRCIGSY